MCRRNKARKICVSFTINGGPRPVNAIIENGRSVTQLMGFLVSCFWHGSDYEFRG